MKDDMPSVLFTWVAAGVFVLLALWASGVLV